MKEGQTFHIDSDQVKQYEGERIVDDVTLQETPSKKKKWVLVHSPKLQANVLVLKTELKD